MSVVCEPTQTMETAIRRIACVGIVLTAIAGGCLATPTASLAKTYQANDPAAADSAADSVDEETTRPSLTPLRNSDQADLPQVQADRVGQPARLIPLRSAALRPLTNPNLMSSANARGDSTLDRAGGLKPIASFPPPLVPDETSEIESLSDAKTLLSNTIDSAFINTQPQVIFVLLDPSLDESLLTPRQLKQLANSIPPRDSRTQLVASATSSEDRADSGGNPLGYDDVANPVQLVGFQQDVQDEKEAAKSQDDAGDDKNDPHERNLADLESQIEDQKKLITANEAIDPLVKKEQLDTLNKASQWLLEAKDHQNTITQQDREAKNFNDILSDLQKGLQQSFEPKTPDEQKGAEALQMELQDKRQQLELRKTELGSNKTRIENREQRIGKLPGERTAVREELKKIDEQFAELASQPDDVAKQLATINLEAKKLAKSKERDKLDRESTRIEQTGKTLPLRRDLLNKQIRVLEAEVAAWDSLYQDKRNAEIEDQRRQADEAVRKLVNANPTLRALAEKNQALTARREELTNQIKVSRRTLLETEEAFKKIDDNFKVLKADIETGDITTAEGMALVEQRQSLMQPFKTQERIARVRQELQQIQTEKLEIKEARDNLLSAPEEYFESAAVADSGTTAKDQLPIMAKDLAGKQREYLDSLERDLDVYLDSLGDEEAKGLTLIEKIDEVRAFIDRNALWIRNADLLELADFSKSANGLAAYFNWGRWQNLSAMVRGRILNRPYESALAGFLLLGLFVVSRRLKESHA